ncbi:uncharacterized protein LOC134255056 [Saccostrea cucullata]|uniref:uncharacterized protein LOC134255056 n=1 Tax=Saccostrea cuccullata TaxID=36930 RepID=UPI002ED4977B
MLDIMEKYVLNSEKLARLGSTQGNESFNRQVASKAPKANHYSSSSLKYRVATSVLQKNDGHSYVTNVNRRLGLSPGYFTERLAKIRDLQHKRRKAIALTFKAKQRRRFLKSKRQQGSSTS